MDILRVKNLSKSFGDLKAVDDVSFTVPEGSIFGLIGRNGAGKTTTIRMMMNIYVPDKGEVFFKNEKIDHSFKEKVGYLPEERGLYKKMKILDLLMFFAEIKGKSGKKVKNRAIELLDKFSLKDRINSDPEFIILDEPFAGLDPINIEILKDIIMQLKKSGKVIIFSTHLMEFAEKMCDHIAMIDNGKIIMSGSLNELKASYGHKNVSIRYEGDISFLNEHPIIEKITDFGNITGIRVKEQKDIQTLLQLLVENKIIINKFDANEISLQEIFIELAGKEVELDEKKEVQYV